MAQDMGGKRYTQDEIDQIIAMTAKGLFCREIAEKLGRPEQGIRSIRRRLGLVKGKVRVLSSLRQEDLTERVKVLEEELDETIEATNHNEEGLADAVNELIVSDHYEEILVQLDELKVRVNRLEEKMNLTSPRGRQGIAGSHTE